MPRGRFAWTLVLVTAFTIANPGPAGASFSGTPGKVASLLPEPDTRLQIWDPVDGSTVFVTETVMPRTDSSLYGTNGRPVWSPDGTKVAFVKTIADHGDFELQGQPVTDHTAIHVYDLETAVISEVSHPPDGLKPKQVGDSAEGHVVADFAPSWSADGSTIAFTRQIDSVGDADPLWDQRGTNLYTVPAGGGGATQVTHFTNPVDGQVVASVGIPKVGGFVTEVKRFPEGASEPVTELDGPGGALATRSGFATIADFDVSPDGTQLAYTEGTIGLTTSGQAFIVPLDGSAPEQSLGSVPGTFLRFSNTGSGILRFACARSGQMCGMGEHPLDDGLADIRPGEPDRLVNTSTAVGPVGAGGTQTGVDVQPQTLPVIYIPGFLGSQIACNGSVYWPAGGPFGSLLRKLALDAGGAGTPGCPGADTNGQLVLSVLGKPVYGPAQSWVVNHFGAVRANVFAWDWRRSPQPSVSRLDAAIDNAINRLPIAKKQGVRRVVIVAHSYGGLLTRAYLQQHKEKVARVLTLGTPYWGSPKAVFPLALGVETPVNDVGLDYFIGNDNMQYFARNLAGDYQLFPGPAFGQWLSLNGVPQSAAGIASYVHDRAGNAGMLSAARSDHANMYDKFFDNNSLIDYRAVAGTGLATMGKVDLKVTGDDNLVDVTINWINGDQTVPAISAGQGPIGVFPPAGDPVHVQYSCGIDHVALGGSSAVLDRYADFLDTGRAPRKLGGRCGFKAMQAEFNGLRAPRVSVHQVARAGVAARTLSPFAAANAGLAQVVALKKRTIVEYDPAAGITLTARLRGTVTLTPLSDGGKGKALRYRVRGKRISIAPGRAGAAPVVRQGAKRLKPIRRHR